MTEQIPTTLERADTQSSASHSDCPRWYLVQSRPNQADRAEENLLRQGYSTFLPRFSAQRIRRGRRVEVQTALFPNYLFIRLSRWSDNWYPLRSTRGVSRLVTFGSNPLPVPDNLIEAIRQRIEQGTIKPAFAPGERVELIEGPFQGLDAIFAAQRDEERVILLIELLHRQVQVTVPVSGIRKSA
ncbi:transcription/translation regulatory transformer protein RfaH [Halochromatium sp.]